jgi:hypothetical protein
MYGLAPGNNIYGLNLTASQIFHAEFLSNSGRDIPHIYIQDPNNNLRKPIIKPFPGGLSITFVSATTGKYGVIIDSSSINHSSTYRLNVKEVRTASSQDKMDFAIQSCNEYPIPRKQGTVGDELKFFDTCFYGLSHLVADVHPEIMHLSANVYEDINLMISRWDKKPVSALYRRSLNAIYGGFEVAQNVSDRDKTFSILSVIASDIRIKAEHCRQSKTGRGLGDPVKLIVTTVQDGTPIKGYLVFCVPTLEEYQPSQPIPFDRLSDPEAERDLPPGEYKVWGEKSESQRMKIKNPVQIGFGEATQKMPIYVP